MMNDFTKTCKNMERLTKIVSRFHESSNYICPVFGKKMG